jgi:hypothetical protein
MERKTWDAVALHLHSSVQVPCVPNKLHVNMHTCSFRHNRKHETDRQQTQHAIAFVVCLYFWPACACLNAYANVRWARMADLEPARYWIHLGHLLWQLRGSPTAVGRAKQHTLKLVVLHVIQNLKLVCMLCYLRISRCGTLPTLSRPQASLSITARLHRASNAVISRNSYLS